VKYLSLGAKGGIILFFFIMIVYVIVTTIFPPLLVALAFTQDLHIYILGISIYVGCSFPIAYIISQLKSQPNSKKKQEAVPKKLITIITAGLFLIVGPCLGWFTYGEIISISAYSLHQSAPKEDIEVDVIANSVWSASRDIRKNCQDHMLFDTPKISSAIQYVCIDWRRWAQVYGGQKNFKVTLYGRKSYYGYELRCCK
jgi:hypothetical protein